MSTQHKVLSLTLSSLFLVMVPGCFFPMDRDPISIPVYRGAALERTLPATLYYDLDQIRTQNGGRPAGLVVYSVGYSACTPSAQSLANMLAERGYVVAIPHHNDLIASCVCVPGILGGKEGPEDGERRFNSALQEFSGTNGEKAFSEEQLEEFFYYRTVDLFATVEHLTHTDSYEFGSLMDKPVFLVGYSLGGWNALNVAGAGSLFPELQCDVTAVICQNTFVGELTEERLQQVSCPVLYLASTEDALCPDIRRLYDWRPSNARMVEIVGADHYIFATDLCSSPILSALYPGTCGESTKDIAKRANALTVEFIAVLNATNEVPMIEDLECYSPDIFSIVR